MFGGLFCIIKELKIGTIIVGKQYENYKNYEKLKEIVREKKVNIKIVEAGNRINIEKGLYVDVIWPCRRKYDISKCD